MSSRTPNHSANGSTMQVDSMREIRPYLWLGHALDGRDLRALHDHGILAVVDLALEERPAQLSRDLAYCRFPLTDGAGNRPALLRAAIVATAGFIRDQVQTLVCCGAGMSRSPAIVAAALTWLEGESLESHLTDLIAGQPHDVSPALLAEIAGVLAEPR